MEKELVAGNIGENAKYDVTFKDGDVVAEISFAKGVAEIELKAKLDGKQVCIAALEYLKAKIPGNMEDVIVNALEEKLKLL